VSEFAAPAFDHREPGTPEPAWLDALAGAPAVVVPTGARVLVVAAHPDDETLGAGGLIAAAGEAGSSVTVVVATDGEASHPDSPTYTAAHLAKIRQDEVRAAVLTLAPAARLVLLHLPDGGLADRVDELAAALSTHAAAADVIVTPWRADGHPDHEACAAAVTRVLAPHSVHWQYPIWFWHWGRPSRTTAARAGLRRFPLTERQRAAKAAALDCHRSQHAPLSAAPGDEAILPPHVVAHFRRDFECYVVPGEPPDNAPAAGPAYFDALYRTSPDPWGLDERFYEQRKRDLVIASLPRHRFRRAFEPGCATGALTTLLAHRCDELQAWDGAAAAVSATRARLDGRGGVRVERRRIPDDWPQDRFDLIVLSEVGYYCVDLALLARRIDETLDPDGVLVACHWRHPAPDHPHGAAAVHDAIGAGLHQVVRHEEDDFLLEVWNRTGRSVARESEIVR
jgi:LmbE family N-acetylglucosaminyl deacetylase